MKTSTFLYGSLLRLERSKTATKSAIGLIRRQQFIMPRWIMTLFCIPRRGAVTARKHGNILQKIILSILIGMLNIPKEVVMTMKAWAAMAYR